MIFIFDRWTIMKSLAYGKIVDIGCNLGEMFGDKATNVDIHSLEDKRKESGNPNLIIPNFVQADANNLPFADQEFDTAVCFTGDTIVYGGKNKRISEIENSDSILNSTGNKQKTIKKMNRTFSGELIRIKPMGLLPIYATEEHPILTTKIRRVHRANRKKDAKHKYEYMIEKNIWKKASELTNDDWLIVPRTKYEIDTEIEIRIGRKAHNAKDKRDRKTFKIDEEIAFLFGLWMAEGTIVLPKSGGGKVYFHMGSHEKELIASIQKIAKEKFNLNSNLEIRKTKSSTNVVICNKDLALFLSKEFGRGAYNKRISPLIMNAKKQIIMAFLEGYWRGDGDLNLQQMRMVTVSKHIINDIMQLCFKIGISFSISERENDYYCKTKLKKTSHQYTIQFSRLAFQNKEDAANRKACQRMKITENYSYVKITNIKRIKVENVQVFNLSTEDNTYCVPFIVHNCGEILEHMDDPVATLNEAQRIAKIVIFSVPNEYQWSGERKPFTHYDHKNNFDEQKVFDLVLKSGLQFMEYIKIIYAGWSYFIVVGASKHTTILV